MTETSPTVVGMYDRDSDEDRRVAEFRLTPEGKVALTVFDPIYGRLAWGFYTEGV